MEKLTRKAFAEAGGETGLKVEMLGGQQVKSIETGWITNIQKKKQLRVSSGEIK